VYRNWRKERLCESLCERTQKKKKKKEKKKRERDSSSSSVCNMNSTEVRRYYYIVQRRPELGRSALTDTYCGVLYFPFETANPTDRNSSEWNKFLTSVKVFYEKVEPAVQHVRRVFNSCQTDEELCIAKSYFCEEVASLPLRPPTPIGTEVPTPLGKQCSYPVDPVPSYLPQITIEQVIEVAGHDHVF